MFLVTTKGFDQPGSGVNAFNPTGRTCSCYKDRSNYNKKKDTKLMAVAT